ncbi:hypothetical protein O6H91_22G009900 [Diphasiastrum complanatum]|uniref:Uncharacterized protein n=1 Tax=Diphasiastrum complanatum TaxID=34168 RepID=A0ACC2ACR9_DIPCM|nr:hypothetical protein O6H91_22G009900 [Diphasiastrum complanatum]
MSTSSGLLGKDIMSFGNNSMIGEEHLTFGCETIETGDLFYQDADGIMGLGRGPLSIVDQLVEHKAMSNSFSLCYGGMDEGGGAMILGAIPPPPEMVFTASEPHRSPYYNLGLKGLRVAGNPLSIDPSVFNGRFGTILDSGTTYAYFPEKAYNVFRDAVKQQLGKLQEVAGPDPNFPDVCFAGAGNDPIDLPKHFPSVDLVFEGGEVVSLAPENYLFRHTRVPGAYCLGIFKNGKDPTTLLGGIVVRNMLVTYDRAKDKIGFWKTKCTDLWMNLPAVVPPSGAEPIKDPNGISPSPERLPPSSGPKETPGTPQSQYVPVPAPEQGAAHYVGGIEVQMILSTNYSIFSTLTSEFLEVIAHELDVKRSQVSIVKYKDQGRNVSVLWRILPAATENQIMGTTAQSIISRLQGHEIHLGGHFGMYELTSWKMIPTSTRSWLSHWHLVVIAAIAASAIAVIAVGLLVYWHLWRYRDKGRSKKLLNVQSHLFVAKDKTLQLEIEEWWMLYHHCWKQMIKKHHNVYKTSS